MDIAEFLNARWREEEERLTHGWYSDTHWEVFETCVALGAWTVSRRRGIGTALSDEIALAGMNHLRTLQDEWRRQEAVPRLADIAAKHTLLAEVASWQHLVVDGDTWLSCAQAVDQYSDERTPGSGCADDQRAGGPCDCGLEQRRETVLRLLVLPYVGHADYDESWRQ